MNNLLVLTVLAAMLFTAGYAEMNLGSQKSPQAVSEKSIGIEENNLEKINTSLLKGPVFLKIGSDWCGPCQEMKPALNELTTEYQGKATIISVDVDQNPELAEYFGVSSIPDSTVIVKIENGKYVYMQEDGNLTKDRFKARILGLMDKETCEKVLNYALQKEDTKSK
jgi:thioredoxin-like negative regulator of GroEL